MKTEKELKKLNAERINKYFRAEIRRFYAWYNSHFCECCGEPFWVFNSELDVEKRKEEFLKEVEIKKSYLKKVGLIKNYINETSKKI